MRSLQYEHVSRPGPRLNLRRTAAFGSTADRGARTIRRVSLPGASNHFVRVTVEDRGGLLSLTVLDPADQRGMMLKLCSTRRRIVGSSRWQSLLLCFLR